MNAGRCFVQATAVLVMFTVARQFGLLGPPAVAVTLLTGALALIAWRASATFADLGLSRENAGDGLVYGAASTGVIFLGLIVATVIPWTNALLHDRRAEVGVGSLLYQVGVSAVLLTAIPEEFAFRGILLGAGRKLWGARHASLITSALFGLWHIAPILRALAGNRAVSGAYASVSGRVLVVLGAVAVTFLAGLVLCWLEIRSKSLIAPVIAHAAAGGLALIIAWLTVH